MKKKLIRYDFWMDPAFQAVIDDFGELETAIVGPALEPAQADALIATAHIYHVSPAKDEIPKSFQVDSSFLARAPNLVCVSSGGAGHDTVDVAACTEAGVLVVNQAGCNAQSVAEMTIGMMIAASRRIVESHVALVSGLTPSREYFMGHDISGKTLGVVGIGHIGTKVAHLAKAFGMTVLAYDPLLDAEDILARGAMPVDFDTLCATADVVSLHCPRNETTLGMFDADAFSRMKKGAIFVSTARGGIHSEADLYDALVSRHLGSAALDVWDVEPPLPDSGLLQLANVIATYHTSGVSHEARRSVAVNGAQQIVRLFRGETPRRLVNPQVLDRALGRLRDLAAC